MIIKANLPLRLVTDASMLVAEILRRTGRVRLAHAELDLFVPEYTLDEAWHELPKRIEHLARHRSMTPAQRQNALRDAATAVDENVTVVPMSVYLPYESEARWRIARDPRDWPTVALALALGVGIWTEDSDFLGCGIATWTTSTLKHLLAILDNDTPQPPTQ